MISWILGIQIRHFTSAKAKYYSKTHRVHARPAHYGRAQHSWVMIDSGEEQDPWFGRLMQLFCIGTLPRGPWWEFALVWYVNEFTPGREHVIGARHFTFHGSRPEIVQVESILQPAHLLPSPIKSRGEMVFVALPYGLTHESTRVGWTYDEEEDEEEAEEAEDEY